MKKSLFGQTLKQTFLAIPAAAIILGASQTGHSQSQIGIHFFGQGGQYGNTSITATAFGIDPTNWFMTSYTGAGISGNGANGTNYVATLASGVSFNLNWSSSDVWDSDIGDNGSGAPTPGNAEVTWGYLDDGSPGYSVTISGLRSFASSYSLQTIAASDNATGFGNVNLSTNNVPAESLNYTNDPSQFTAAGGAGYGTSTVSSVYATLNGNDSVTLTGAARSGSIRSTMAAIILTYTPGNNAPLFETQPQSITNNLFTGSPFNLSATISGTPAFSYQWFLNGSPISGANTNTYSVSSSVSGNSGNYTLVVNNNYGSVTSAVAVVTVQNLAAPVVTQVPLSQSVYPTYPATFMVAATGGQLTYQWELNNVAISGATNSTYTVASAATNNVGTYTVAVNNPVGPAATASATLGLKIPTPGSYEAIIVQTRPDLWFRYSETGAMPQDTAANSGSLGTAGTGLYNGVTHAVPGAIVASTDTAASFNGGTAIVKVPYSAQLNPATFTAEAWVKPVAATTGSPAVMSIVDAGSTRAGWLIYQTATAWDLRTYNQNGATVSMEVLSSAAPVIGSWSHLAVTYDGTTLTLYVNGVSAGTAVNTGGLYVPSTAGAYTLGARSDGGFPWAGVIDEAAFYNSVLTAGQILSHYQNGTNATPSQSYTSLITSANPLEYLHLDEPAFIGKTAHNSGTAGAAWNGVFTDGGGVVGSPQIVLGQSGPLPPAFPGFESTNTAVSMVTNGYTSVPAYPLGNAVTVVSWINTPAASGNSAGDLSWIAWLGDAGQSGFFLGSSDNQLHYQWQNLPSSYDFNSGLIVPAQTWTFVAMVVQPSQTTIYMSSGTNLLSAVHTLTQTALNDTEPLGFGGNQPGSPTRSFVGQLDESAVYSRALTPGEINALFKVSLGAPFQVAMVPGGVIKDTKPVGTPHNGFNGGTTWTNSSTDFNSITRTGVEQFSETNNTQITVPADPDFNSTNGTISFWVNYAFPFAGLPGSGSEGATLFDRRTTTSGTVIVLNPATGSIEFQSLQTTNDVTFYTGFTNTLNAGYIADGNWHNVTITYDQASNGVVSIYTDGAFNVSATNIGSWTWPTNQEIELGRSHDSYWYVYDGQMDDVRIYNQILTPSEISVIGKPSTSDMIEETNALVLRFNFDSDSVFFGNSVTWPYGTLLSSPVLGPGAVWTPQTNAVSPQPIAPTAPAMFYRASLP